MSVPKIKTLGELKASGYKSKSIKAELRDNLIIALKKDADSFTGILGYEDTVIPQVERAILSGHNINLLGLRGQAKTRIARSMVNLLDEYIPAIQGSELNDDPMLPISKFGKDMVAELGDQTPIKWIHRSERYFEKLATPDVTVADLIGDVDPIKAANLKLTYADEKVIHFGMIPRAHRSIFVINELPDLQARIQVALFNILQEGDVQIRGFQLRLPLDVQFIFTANPEDYTNRGSIVTPLKDRIGSQIFTHYPEDRSIGKSITKQEIKVAEATKKAVHVPELALDLIEQVAIEARQSEYVDAKSGVSVRMTISALENLYATAERRMLIAGDKKTNVRMSDLLGILPAISGKVELVYEGEQEGAENVAENLIEDAVRTVFHENFPKIEKLTKNDDSNVYLGIMNWFGEGNRIDLVDKVSDNVYADDLKSCEPLINFMKNKVKHVSKEDYNFWAEFILWGLAVNSKLSRETYSEGTAFADLFGSILGSLED